MLEEDLKLEKMKRQVNLNKKNYAQKALSEKIDVREDDLVYLKEDASFGSLVKETLNDNLIHGLKADLGVSCESPIKAPVQEQKID